MPAAVRELAYAEGRLQPPAAYAAASFTLTWMDGRDAIRSAVVVGLAELRLEAVRLRRLGNTCLRAVDEQDRVVLYMYH